ncbi:MAG: hypothetical protein OK438_01045 [Thaumarchaeota archaeon]|nr:hypothetical protein [Nitrososphaerota archaeon]
MRRVWLFSLVVGVGTVAGFFWYANYAHGHNWIPLGYDSYYYVGWINQVVASGPLQFAASQHYVDFLYPIVASVPVYLGASADIVEIVLPILLACALVAATGILALESKDWRVVILSVAFSGGWFAVYRMGADFHANLFAFPLLILASALLIRAARRGEASGPILGGFLALVVVAGAAHVETTDFFIAAWFVAFVPLGWKTSSGSWRWSSFMVVAGALTASPFTLAYFQGVAGGLGGQYCVLPAYWLEVFGPGAGLAILGLGTLAWRYKAQASEGYLTKLLLSWSALALGIGVLGYVAQVPISFSDRALLLFPLPIVSSFGMLWLVGNIPRLQGFSQTRLLAVLVVIVPLLTAPLVFSYTAPHFIYFAEHGPSLVTCATG